MSLEVDIVHRRGTFELAADFRVESGLTALFGASGSGKTTLVNLVAGLLRPARGRIVLGDRVWADAERGIFLPAWRRRIGYVFQEGRLFPHMSVRRNLLYGRGFLPRSERRDDFDRIVALLAIGHLLERPPDRLSGGEKQRVALGRALLAGPRLLLMDEPLSALDAGLKAAILPYIERVRDEAGVPILYVSHALEEVARLATHVVLLDAGRAVMLGSAGAAIERLPAIAGLARAGSFVRARIVAQHAEEGITIAEAAAGRLYLRHAAFALGTPVRVFVPAADVVIAAGPVEAVSTLNRFPGTVVRLEPDDAGMSVEVDCRGERVTAEITRRSAAELDLQLGKPVTLLFKALSLGPQSLFRENRG